MKIVERHSFSTLPSCCVSSHPTHHPLCILTAAQTGVDAAKRRRCTMHILSSKDSHTHRHPCATNAHAMRNWGCTCGTSIASSRHSTAHPMLYSASTLCNDAQSPKHNTNFDPHPMLRRCLWRVLYLQSCAYSVAYFQFCIHPTLPCINIHICSCKYAWDTIRDWYCFGLLKISEVRICCLFSSFHQPLEDDWQFWTCVLWNDKYLMWYHPSVYRLNLAKTWKLSI